MDWLRVRMTCGPTVPEIREGLRDWPGEGAAERKLEMFTDSQIQIALDRLQHAD